MFALVLLKPLVVLFQLQLESISVLDVQILLGLIIYVAKLSVDEVYLRQQPSSMVVELKSFELQDVLMKLDFSLQHRVCLQRGK